jgi:hypothetical protein
VDGDRVADEPGFRAEERELAALSAELDGDAGGHDVDLYYGCHTVPEAHTCPRF